MPPPNGSALPEKLVMNFGDSVVFKGELSGSEDLTFCGQMQGERQAVRPHRDDWPPRRNIADISQGGRDQRRRRRQCHGQQVVESSTGSVTGDIKSPRLAIADGGYFRGEWKCRARGSPIG
jgi:hypothetical protein